MEEPSQGDGFLPSFAPARIESSPAVSAGLGAGSIPAPGTIESSPAASAGLVAGSNPAPGTGFRPAGYGWPASLQLAEVVAVPGDFRDEGCPP